MALEPLNYHTESPAMPDFQGISYTPDELYEKMAVTSQEFHHAISELEKLQVAHAIKEASLTVIIQAKNFDMLKNPVAKELFKRCCEDPKGFRPTVDFTNSLIYMEEQELMEKFHYWEKRKNWSEKYYNMLSGMLIWQQSKNKVNAAEMISLGGLT